MQRLHDIDCFLAPRAEGDLQLWRLADGALEAGGTVSLSYGSGLALNDRGHLVARVRDGRRLWIGRFDPEGLTVEHRCTLKLPDGAKAEAPSLALVGDVAYVGGDARDSTLLGLVDLAADDPELTSMTDKLPPKMLDGRKTMDALVTDGETLWVVDDLVFPKYLLVYDVSRPRVPRFGALVDLPLHGTGEKYFGADLGSGYLALLSSTFGRAGVARHVSLLDCGTRIEVAALHHWHEVWETDEGLPPAGEALEDALICGPRLWLRDRVGGVGALDLPPLPERADDADPVLPEDFSRAPELPVPEMCPLPQLEGEPLVDLLHLPCSDALVALGTEGRVALVQLDAAT